MRKATVALAVFLSACSAHSSTTDLDELQTGPPVVWPAGTPTATTDPNQDYGIWGPSAASSNNP